MNEPTIDRRKHLGGGDISAILGLDPYRSPLSVYNAKLGIAEKEPPSVHMIWGRNVEDAIVTTYRELAKPDVWLGPAGVTPPHPLFPFLRGHYDRTEKSSAKADPHAVIEAKWAGLRQAAKWSDPDKEAPKTPVHYFCQAQYYAGLLGLPEVVIVAKQAWRDDLAVYRFPFDEELFDHMTEAGARFWTDHVMAGVPPPPEMGKSTQDDLVRLFPEGSGEIVDATEELQEQWDEAFEAFKSKRAAEEVLTRFKTACQFTAGDASAVQFADAVVKIIDRKGSVRWKDCAAMFAEKAGIAAGAPEWTAVTDAFCGKPTRYCKLPFDSEDA